MKCWGTLLVVHATRTRLIIAIRRRHFNFFIPNEKKSGKISLSHVSAVQPIGLYIWRVVAAPPILMMPGMEGCQGLSVQGLGTARHGPATMDDVGVLWYITWPIIQVMPQFQRPAFPIVRLQKGLAVAVIFRWQHLHRYTFPIHIELGGGGCAGSALGLFL
jgi:hypothetical protein